MVRINGDTVVEYEGLENLDPAILNYKRTDKITGPSSKR